MVSQVVGVDTGGADAARAPGMDRRRVATMRDVAAAAGVSISAVSYVVNGSRPVSADKRARVLRAMAELEFVPNGMARALRQTRTGLLGVILPDLANPTYGLIAKHVEAAASAAGYMTVVCSSAGDDDARVSAYVRKLEGMRVDGFVLRATREQRELIPSVLLARAPAVLVMHDPPSIGRQLDRVLIDNALGVRLAVRHLAQFGHRRIGLVSTQDLSQPTLVRLQGFLQGMAEAGLHADMAHVRIGAANAEAGEALASELLDLRGRPTALIVAHGHQARGALRALRARGLHVPDDLSLVVFGRPEFFEQYPVDLSVVVQPFPEMGEAAAHHLLARLRHGDAHAEPPQQVVLAPFLQAGTSVGPPPR